MPWDERIHAGTKVKTADGTWRMKRNVDPALVTTVTAELRALMNVPAGGAPAVAEPWPFAVPGAAPAVPNVPAPAPAPPSPTIQTAASVVTDAPGAVAKLQSAATFADLMASIPGLVQNNLVTMTGIMGACSALGLPNGVQGLHARPDLIPVLRDKLLELVPS